MLMPSALDFEPFLAELRQAVKTAWPEVSGVYDGEHADQQQWEGFGLPYAVIAANSWQSSPTRPMDRIVLQGNVIVTYVALMDGKATLFREKLTALVNALWPDALTNCTLVNVGAMGWDDSTYPNMVLNMRDSKQRAGAVTFTVWVTA